MEEKQSRSRVAAKATKQTENNAYHPAEAFATLIELNRAAIDASVESGEALMKAAVAFNAETLDFASRCMNEAMSVGSIAASDKDWRGIMNVQGGVATSLIEECTKETETVITLTLETMRSVAQPWTKFYWEALPGAMRPGSS